MGSGGFSPWFQAIVCLLKYYKRAVGGRSHGQEGGKRVLISRVSLLLTEQWWLEHFGGKSAFSGFLNPEIAVGYWSRNVLAEGLGGKAFLAWSCFIFSLVCDKAGNKGEKLLPPAGGWDPGSPCSHIDLNFIS